MKENKEQAVMIDRRDLWKKLFQIALPIAIQGVVTAALTFMDNLMVGTLGEAEIAGIGIASQIFSIHHLFLFGINGGVATYLTQFYGMRDHRNIRKILGLAITIAVFTGAIFFIIGFFFTNPMLHIWSSDAEIIALARPYVKITSLTFLLLAISMPIEFALKSTQNPRFPMAVSLLVFGLNVLLNYIFIFGHFGAPALGLTGAAVATVLSRGVAVCIDLLLLRKENLQLKGPLGDYVGWSKDMVMRVLRNMTPVIANDVFWSLGTSMYVVAFSRIDTTSYAAYQTALSIYYLFTFAVFSVGDASLILIGEKLGEGKRDYAYALAVRLLKIAAGLGILVGLFLIAIAWPVLQIYGLTALGKAYAFRIMVVYGLTMFIHICAGVCTTGILRGGGDTRYAAIGEICTMWLLAVPMAFASALWWHLPIYLCVLCTVAGDLGTVLIMVRRIRSKKWMNDMISGL